MRVGGQHHAPAALPPGKIRYPLYRRLGGPQGRSGRVRKILSPPGFDPRIIQSIASCYTDYTILAAAMQFYKWLSSWCGHNYDYAFITNQNCDKNWQECCLQEKIFNPQVKVLATVQDPTYRQTWLLIVYALFRILNKFLQTHQRF